VQRLISVSNDSNKTEKIKDPISARLERFSSVIKCEVEGALAIGGFTTISNSRIGRYFGIGCYSYMRSTICKNYISIGSRVSIGGLNHPTDWLSTHSFQYEDVSNAYDETLEDAKLAMLDKNENVRVRIGNDVWIGDNAVILSGVEIADGVIIGAGSVVTKPIKEPYSIVVGNPGIIKKKRFKEEIIEKIIKTNWWDFKISEMPEKIKFDDIEKSINSLNNQQSEAFKLLGN
tara:strand:+ start:3099 stop:3794 length:696 start_codon:yes stop_codon:yes gene_type:complete